MIKHTHNTHTPKLTHFLTNQPPVLFAMPVLSFTNRIARTFLSRFQLRPNSTGDNADPSILHRVKRDIVWLTLKLRAAVCLAAASLCQNSIDGRGLVRGEDQSFSLFVF
jgi:hypothetical protein